MSLQNSQIPLEQHNTEIRENRDAFLRKAILGKIYTEFHTLIRDHLSGLEGETLELGSGIGLIKKTIPQCICSDVFANPGIDRFENAYHLTCEDESVSNLILIDVFHHLRYPGDALDEWKRGLRKGGHVILFEPCMSLLGKIIYGCFHHEPIAIKDPITWHAESPENTDEIDYYAAQSNAYRVFLKREHPEIEKEWEITKCERYAFLSYVASGGFSKPQLYPTSWYSSIRRVDRLLDSLPALFATRMLVVLKRR